MFSMLNLGCILISDLVVANFFMPLLPGWILLYLAMSFYAEGAFGYYHFCKDENSVVTQIKHNY